VQQSQPTKRLPALHNGLPLQSPETHRRTVTRGLTGMHIAAAQRTSKNGRKGDGSQSVYSLLCYTLIHLTSHVTQCRLIPYNFDLSAIIAAEFGKLSMLSLVI
jgi:hypothetical protein